MGAPHRYHPDPDRGDPEGAVLYDGCDRCAEHAAAPHVSLSEGHLGALWDEMILVERGSGRDHYLTRADADAARVLYRVALFIERWTTYDPWAGWPLDENAPHVAAGRAMRGL